MNFPGLSCNRARHRSVIEVMLKNSLTALLLAATLRHATENVSTTKASAPELKHFQAAADYSRTQHGVTGQSRRP